MHRNDRVILTGALCVLLGLSAPASALTLDSVMSAPFPTELTGSPSDGHVAWVSNERGVRNIMLGSRDGATAVTAYTQDNGYELDHLTWAENGRVIVYTGGGSLEGGGPVNTQSLVMGPLVKDVLAVRIGEGSPRDFGPGEAPTPAPKGDRLVFIRDGQIWTANLDAPAAATQLIHDRGIANGVAWSPDGSKLAFVSHRKQGHAFVGIYDFASRGIRWMSPSVDRDAAPQWSPDGARIAWIRNASTALPEGRRFRGIRSGEPWSLWVGDVATGAGHAVWHADPGAGSLFKTVEDGTMLFWTADNRLVFPWEKTGWIRLYSIPVDGGAVVALTPDTAEAFAATLDAARTHVIFSSNATDDDHRHLWTVAAAGGAPRMLTKGDSIEDLPAVAADGTIFALHGTGRDPLEPVIVAQNGAANGAMKPVYANAASAAFPKAEMAVPQRVVFDSSDAMKVHGQLFLPSAHRVGKRPAILFFHGGPQRQMLLGWHPMGAYTNLYAMNQFLASQGYIVLSVNYRGGTGYGLNWREPEDFAEAGSSEVRDIAGAVRYLKSRPDVDASRLGVYGMSYGGVMTSLALSKLPQEFAAGVDYAGVHDWKSFLPALTEPGAPPGPAEVAFKASAVGSAKDWTAPVLIIQADDDRAVDFAQSIELIGALRDAGHVVPEQFIIPDEVHDMIRHQSWLTMLDKAQEFLMRKLMKKETFAEK